MEDNKVREYKEAQKFYFNEEGQLVVESKKGVWVDGEQFVKMYGYFSCNAKTMGVIINKFKGEKVVFGKYIDDTYQCELVNPTEYDEQVVREMNAVRDKLKEICEKYDNDNRKLADIIKHVEQFNALPWYKRIFKKITV